jgi:glycosyltransferase involved in cell wall biosynthesis
MGLVERLRRRERHELRMSVVVAVYNTGRYLDACVNSLLAQTMPTSDHEVIFVDDGSTDGTGARLDEVAAAHDHVSVIHIPNSGWPGKPRNVGIDAARGEYVYFLDHDDSLRPEALERMYAMASRNRADVVIGKIVGRGRRVPPTLFDHNRESCSLDTAPLLESMTPHKGFRRAFLVRHGIRFPEGRRRLEDHRFVVEAYLRADVVSVLADYTCYVHIARDDGGNAGFLDIDPVGYYRNLEECVDVAERLTSPGQRRDRVMRRWYRVEMLRRVTGPYFLGFPEEKRRAVYAEVRRLALERFTSPGIWEPMPAAFRTASDVLRTGSFDDMVAAAEWQAGLRAEPTTERWEWGAAGLLLGLLVEVRAADGTPAIEVRAGEGRYAVPSPLVSEVSRTTRTDPKAVLELRLRGREERRRVACRVAAGPGDGPFRLLVSAAVDPGDVGGRPLASGVWDLFLRLRHQDLGRELVRRVGAPAGMGSGSRPEPAPTLLAGGAVVLPYATDKGNASLDVGEHVRSLPALLTRRSAVSSRPARATGGAAGAAADGGVEVDVTAPMRLPAGAGPGTLRLVALLPDGVEVSAAARTAAGAEPGTTVISARLPSVAGGAPVELELAPGAGHRVGLGSA